MRGVALLWLSKSAMLVLVARSSSIQILSENLSIGFFTRCPQFSLLSTATVHGLTVKMNLNEREESRADAVGIRPLQTFSPRRSCHMLAPEAVKHVRAKECPCCCFVIQ